MISIKTSGSTKNLESFLQRVSQKNLSQILHRLGSEGVAALAAATPTDSGLAAQSWGYEIRKTRGSVSIIWTNSDTENGFPVAIALQYGYGTGTGGFVAGRDYINPAMRPVFDRIANEVWREVTSA